MASWVLICCGVHAMLPADMPPARMQTISRTTVFGTCGENAPAKADSTGTAAYSRIDIGSVSCPSAELTVTADAAARDAQRVRFEAMCAALVPA